MEMEGYDKTVWGKFCEAFDKAVFDCADTGKPFRLKIGIDKSLICVDVYPAGGTMKKFDEMMLKAVKEKTGIDILGEKNGETK